jgi:hypothetical protein
MNATFMCKGWYKSYISRAQSSHNKDCMENNCTRLCTRYPTFQITFLYKKNFWLKNFRFHCVMELCTCASFGNFSSLQPGKKKCKPYWRQQTTSKYNSRILLDDYDLQEVPSTPIGKIHASTNEHYLGIWFWFTMIAL